MPLRRNTARVLPVDAEGRVLPLHGWLHPGQLEDGTERPADLRIARPMRAAAAVRGPR